jgi:predicted solute-binding protein
MKSKLGTSTNPTAPSIKEFYYIDEEVVKEYIKSINYHFPTEKIGFFEKIINILFD